MEAGPTATPDATVAVGRQREGVGAAGSVAAGTTGRDMHRRELLRTAARGTAALGLTARESLGLAGRAWGGPRIPTVAYRTVVDAVDAGADPTGEEPVDDVLQRLLEHDTLVWFPEGTYAIEGLRVSGLRNVGLASRPGARATLRPAVPAAAMDHRFLEFDGVDELAVQGFDLDYRRAGYGGAVRVLDAGDVRVRHCRVRGTMPDRNHPTTPAAFRFEVTDPDATGLAEGLVARDGGHDGGNAIGIYVGHRHAGTLVVRDCEVAGFPNNGLYASAPGYEGPEFRGRDGAVHVRGGVYRNNNVANVRLGSTGSTAREVSILIDRTPPSFAGSHNARGLRLRNKGDQVVADCHVALGPDAGYGFGGLVFHPDAGDATVRDTTVEVDADGRRAINALADGSGAQPGPTFSNVAITGAADGGWAVALAGRDGVLFEDCTIRQTGRNRNGISLTDCRDCTIAGGSIAVPGDPLRNRRSTLLTRNLTTRDPAPE